VPCGRHLRCGTRLTGKVVTVNAMALPADGLIQIETPQGHVSFCRHGQYASRCSTPGPLAPSLIHHGTPTCSRPGMVSAPIGRGQRAKAFAAATVPGRSQLTPWTRPMVSVKLS